MVLKSLILQGFKSFPDRTEIKFLGGMTAIVGRHGEARSGRLCRGLAHPRQLRRYFPLAVR